MHDDAGGPRQGSGVTVAGPAGGSRAQNVGSGRSGAVASGLPAIFSIRPIVVPATSPGEVLPADDQVGEVTGRLPVGEPHR